MRKYIVGVVNSALASSTLHLLAFVAVVGVTMAKGICIAPILALWVGPSSPWEALGGSDMDWTPLFFVSLLLTHTKPLVIVVMDLGMLLYGLVVSWNQGEQNLAAREDAQFTSTTATCPNPSGGRFTIERKGDGNAKTAKQQQIKNPLLPPAAKTARVAEKLKHGLESRAVAGDVKAQFQMANLYALRGNGLLAFDWYRQAANHGNKDAFFAIAKMFVHGRLSGISKDATRALEWVRRAAEQGHGEAVSIIKKVTVAEGNDAATEAALASALESVATDSKGSLSRSRRVAHSRSKSAPTQIAGDLVFQQQSPLEPSPLEPSPPQPGAPTSSHQDTKKMASRSNKRSRSDRQLLSRSAVRAGMDQRSKSERVLLGAVRRGKSTDNLARERVGLGSCFTGYLKHPLLGSAGARVSGHINGGSFPRYKGLWCVDRGDGKTSGADAAESPMSLRIRRYGVFVMKDHALTAHLAFTSESSLEGVLFVGGVGGGAATIDVIVAESESEDELAQGGQ